MSNLVAYFEYEGIKYYISLLKNKRILFLKSNKNNQFSTDLSNKELERITKVYKSLLINPSKSMYIKELKVNNNSYNIFFDSDNHNYFWIPNNEKYNSKDNIYLNFKYNHYPITIYSNTINNQQETSKFYNKFVKLGKKLIPIFISATLSLTILMGCTVLKQPKIIPPSKTISTSISDETTPSELEEPTEVVKEYDYEEIKQAIETNPNLSDEEKEFMLKLKLKFIFDENHQYMDLEVIIERLNNLKIEYNVDLNGAQASYNLKENKISSIDSNFKNMIKATFLHEFLHALQSSGNPFIGELSTEYFTMETMIRLYKEGIFEKEYFLSEYGKIQLEKGKLKLDNETEWLNYLSENRCFSSGYSGYVNIYCILSEILPPETLRNYQFNPSNIEILAESLNNLDKEREGANSRAIQLVFSINDIREYSEENNTYYYSRDVSKCYEYINYYMNQNKDIDLDEDIISSLYLGLERRLTDDSQEVVFDYLQEIHNIEKPSTIIPKTKLSNAQDKYLLIYRQANGEYQELELNKDIQSEYYSYIQQLHNENKTK